MRRHLQILVTKIRDLRVSKLYWRYPFSQIVSKWYVDRKNDTYGAFEMIENRYVLGGIEIRSERAFFM